MENGCKTKQMENGFRIVLAGGIDMLMELFGVKDTTESSGIDPLSFWYLFGF